MAKKDLGRQGRAVGKRFFASHAGRIFMCPRPGLEKMGDVESESDFRFGVRPFFDVPKIEHRRFSAFARNKKPVLTSFMVTEGRGIRI